MKVYKNGKQLVVNSGDGNIYCLILNYRKKGTIQSRYILIPDKKGGYKFNTEWEMDSKHHPVKLKNKWEYIREATPEEVNKFNELTEYYGKVIYIKNNEQI